MNHEDTIFISHANPEDNEFTKWLALQLVQMGYKVWTDLTKLLGGKDIWKEAELGIKSETAKFIYVVSKISNDKEGPLNELRVAKIVAKNKNIRSFVIPVRIDDLPYDDINIELGRKGVIDFSESWASGLRLLLSQLVEDKIPKTESANATYISEWWRQNNDSTRTIVKKLSPHITNILPITEFPQEIFQHRIEEANDGLNIQLDTIPYAAFRDRDYVISFVNKSELEGHLKKVCSLGTSRRMQIRNPSMLGNFNLNFDQRQVRRFYTRLLHQSWKVYLRRKEMNLYELSQRASCFYFTKGLADKDKIRFRTLKGKKSRRNVVGYKTIKRTNRENTLQYWHFGISAYPIYFPMFGFIIKSHVLFSDDGKNIWENKPALHRARRSQCKDWWNDDWRDRLLATLEWLTGESDSLNLIEEDKIRLEVSGLPASALSSISYDGNVELDEFIVNDYEEDDDALEEETE